MRAKFVARFGRHKEPYQKIQKARLDAAAIQAIQANQSSIATNRKELQKDIEEYLTWYDGLLKR